ncbi:MAG: hypothetical protein R3E21_08070 [Caenibius sp.]
MKHARILPIDTPDEPRRPARLEPMPGSADHIAFARKIERIMNRVQIAVLVPGVMFVLWNVYRGLQAKGMLP